ncbi:hypothetical protein SAMN05216390_13022 [Lachnospiraceae bacterium KH1T2]|nr:hypothetical protein SAMN05216390_13022 [Lachnospiraceae bacterium KH1T2]
MINYTIRSVTLGKKHPRTIYSPIFEDPDMQIVSSFIVSEYSMFKKEIDESLSLALSQKSYSTEFSGNSIMIKITSESSTFESLLDEVNLLPFTISTLDLVDLLKRWSSDIKELNS